MDKEEYNGYAPKMESWIKRQLVDENRLRRLNSTESLLATIYPYISYLVRKYEDMPCDNRTMDSLAWDIDQFEAYLGIVARVPFIPSAEFKRNPDPELALRNIIHTTVDLALNIARFELSQDSVKVSSIMAYFVKGL